MDDLTAPGAVKKIREMDRMGLTARALLTYPEGGRGGASTDEVGEETMGRTALALRRAASLPLVTASIARGVTGRPARRVEHARRGVVPEAASTIESKTRYGRVHALGEVSESMYRDLDSID